MLVTHPAAVPRPGLTCPPSPGGSGTSSPPDRARTARARVDDDVCAFLDVSWCPRRREGPLGRGNGRVNRPARPECPVVRTTSRDPYTFYSPLRPDPGRRSGDRERRQRGGSDEFDSGTELVTLWRAPAGVSGPRRHRAQRANRPAPQSRPSGPADPTTTNRLWRPGGGTRPRACPGPDTTNCPRLSVGGHDAYITKSDVTNRSRRRRVNLAR